MGIDRCDWVRKYWKMGSEDYNYGLDLPLNWIRFIYEKPNLLFQIVCGKILRIYRSKVIPKIQENFKYHCTLHFKVTHYLPELKQSRLIGK